MSYCVNCGVELDGDAVQCPLCQTPVINPVCPPDTEMTPNFPLERQEVEPVDRKELAMLLSAMALCASVCCGLLNLFLLWRGVPWSWFVMGACAMLWVWLVPPLVLRKVPSVVFLLLDLLAVGGLLVLISAATHGQSWLVGIALPVWAGFSLLFLIIWQTARKRSFLSRSLLVLSGIVLFLLWLEFVIDRFLGAYHPMWSLIAAAVGITMMLPLAVIRTRPNLRRQVRRRFHF